MSSGLSADINLCHLLATVADAVSMKYFGQVSERLMKEDDTPVTIADRAVEAAVLDTLRRERPHDSILSEECGEAGPGSDRRWLIDPIDGTVPFLAGRRSWGTHIALEVGGSLQLGLITRPTEGRRWWALRGHGAWVSTDDEPASSRSPLSVSDVGDIAQARIGGFVDPDSPSAAAVRGQSTWVSDPLGDIIGLIEGRVDAVLSPGGAPWDHAPQVLLVLEAGGRYTDRLGGSRHDVGGGAYTNGQLDELWSRYP